MYRRLLFLNTVSDLESKVEAPDFYGLLRSSVLIRQLFLDEGNSLVDQVNREARIKLRFRIVEYADVPEGLQALVTVNLIPDGLDPDVHDSLPDNALAKRVVSRDGFFGAKIGCVNGQYITALDVVKHVAFAMGGIHAGAEKTEQDAVLGALSKTLNLGGVQPAIRILRAAGKGCVRALAPLRAAVTSSLEAEGVLPRSVPDDWVSEVEPSSTFDWSIGEQLFCIVEMRRPTTVEKVLWSYGQANGPSLSMSAGPQGVRFRIVDARGMVHDEFVEIAKLPLSEGKCSLLQYERRRRSESGPKWSVSVTLNGEKISSALFDAALDLSTIDNRSTKAQRAEDVLFVHTIGHGPLPTHEPEYRTKLHLWARQKYNVGG